MLRKGYGEDTKPKKGEMVTVKCSLESKEDNSSLLSETILDFKLGDGDVIDGKSQNL